MTFDARIFAAALTCALATTLAVAILAGPLPAIGAALAGTAYSLGLALQRRPLLTPRAAACVYRFAVLEPQPAEEDTLARITLDELAAYAEAAGARVLPVRARDLDSESWAP